MEFIYKPSVGSYSVDGSALIKLLGVNRERYHANVLEYENKKIAFRCHCYDEDRVAGTRVWRIIDIGGPALHNIPPYEFSSPEDLEKVVGLILAGMSAIPLDAYERVHGGSKTSVEARLSDQLTESLSKTVGASGKRVGVV